MKIGRPGQNAVDARSILAVISLGVKQGESIYLDVEGDRSEDVLDTLAEMLAHTE